MADRIDWVNILACSTPFKQLLRKYLGLKLLGTSPGHLSENTRPYLYTTPPLRKTLLGIGGKIRCNGISRFIEHILIVVIPENGWEAAI
jgi:hypothetical protein